ncbi:MAG TPA: LiaF domain-containing protein, partial [Thermoanaerobaculia bacterium]
FVRRALRREDGEPSPNRLRELAEHQNLALLTTRRVRPGPVFGGGRFAAILGTYQLDLTQATLEHDPTVIEARAFLGAVEIYVPEGWEVIGEVFPVMAGFEMKTVPATEPRRRLVVRGFAMMAGIEVKHIERIGS